MVLSDKNGNVKLPVSPNITKSIQSASPKASPKSSPKASPKASPKLVWNLLPQVGQINGILPCLIVESEDGTEGLQHCNIYNSGDQEWGDLLIPKTGSIKGVVTLNDAEDHTGIDVYIPGTSFIAKTDKEGGFQLANVPPGFWTLVMEKDGYGSGALEDIEVLSETATDINSWTLFISTGVEGNVVIGTDEAIIGSREATLHFNYSANATTMKVSNNTGFLGSNWEPVKRTKTHLFADEGENAVYVSYSDANGLESPPFEAKVIVDSTGPDSEVIINGGDEYTGNKKLSLTIKGDDLSPITEMMISQKHNFAGGSWQSYSELAEYELPEEDGEYSLYVKLKDQWGHVGVVSTDSIILDSTAIQNATITIKEGSYTSNPHIRIDLTANSGVAPIEGFYISEDSNFSWASFIPWNTSVYIPKENTVVFETPMFIGGPEEMYGEENQFEPPQIGPPSYAQYKDVEFAGPLIPTYVDMTQIYDSRYLPPNYTLSAGQGSKTIYVKFLKYGGSELVVNKSIVYDKDAPSQPIVSNTSRRIDTSETVVITTTSTDANFKGYQALGGQYSVWTDVSSNIVFNFTDDDKFYPLSIRAVDLAGNTSDESSWKIFKGAKTILKGGLNDLFAGSDTITLGAAFSPYLLSGASLLQTGFDTSIDFEYQHTLQTKYQITASAYKLVIEAGTNIYVAKNTSLNIYNDLTINGTSAQPVVIDSNEASPSPGDWGNLNLAAGYGLVPTYTISYLQAKNFQGITTRQGGTFTMADSIISRVQTSWAGAVNLESLLAATVSYTTIDCDNVSGAKGLYISHSDNAIIDNVSYLNIQNCDIGLNIYEGTSSVTYSNFTSNTLNIYSQSNDDHTITNNYWSYDTGDADAGTYKTKFKFTMYGSSPTVTWSPYSTSAIGTAGPR